MSKYYLKAGMGTRLGTMTEVPITKQAIDFTDTIRGIFIKLHDRSSCIRDHVSQIQRGAFSRTLGKLI